ncbi:MAG: hypothetical protein ACJAYU_001975 [Bradymonadia bacterium]|jgi:hypothetical protein
MSLALNTSPRSRALRATRAVTFGSLSLAACGTSPVEPPIEDTGTTDTAPTDTAPADTAPTDTAPDVVLPDTSIPDSEPDATICSEIKDDLCPESCSEDDDADCCEDQNDDGVWCSFDPGWGCSCAVEGPFAPPRFAA